MRRLLFNILFCIAAHISSAETVDEMMNRFTKFYNTRQADSLLAFFADTSIAKQAHLVPKKSVDSLIGEFGEIKQSFLSKSISSNSTKGYIVEWMFETTFTKTKLNIYFKFYGTHEIRAFEFRKFVHTEELKLINFRR